MRYFFCLLYTSKLVVDVDKESFFASSKVLKSEGYLQVANPPKKKSFEESKDVYKRQDMYRQYYCGCVFSKEQRDREIAARG